MRQLENAVFRAVVLADGDEVGVADFPQIAALAQRQPAGSPAMTGGGVAGDRAAADRGARVAAARLQEIATPAGSIAPQQQPDGGSRCRCSMPRAKSAPIEELEAEVIRFAIAHYRGQMSEVARRLQIGRSTLYRKLDALGLQQRVAENDTDPVISG